MQNNTFHTRKNIMKLTSIQAFAGIRGGCIKGCKDVYFYRAVGTSKDYLAEIKEMDEMLSRCQAVNGSRYLRIGRLPLLTDPEDAENYARLVSFCRKDGFESVSLIKTKLPENVQQVISSAIKEIRQLFHTYSKMMSSSIELNFLIKILYWSDGLLAEHLKDWTGKTSDKFVFTKIEKIQEYLFCYYLTLLGFDVLILSPAGDLVLDEELLALSSVMKLGEETQVQIPDYHPFKAGENKDASIYKGAATESKKNKVNIKHPKRESAVKKPAVKSYKDSYETKPAVALKENMELEFEELALFAKSVVMIAVHEKDGKVVATGSGIMIGRNGYILTNNHVIREGVFYSVRIEEEEEAYITDEVVKYHSDYDLALIRINRTLEPIRLYQGKKKLVRGQKVVAIGSPLGLFNSVSDGIISGFRILDGVNMIQFTAPISHGSSGGAVLNMQGELIGISTAGIDMGQNLNLAVDYQEIAAFVRGFVQ